MDVLWSFSDGIKELGRTVYILGALHRGLRFLLQTHTNENEEGEEAGLSLLYYKHHHSTSKTSHTKSSTMPGRRCFPSGASRNIGKNYWRGGAPIVSRPPNKQSARRTYAEPKYIEDRLTERRKNILSKRADMDHNSKDGESLNDEEVESSSPAVQMNRGESSKTQKPESSSSGTSTKDKPIVIFKRPSAKALPIRPKPSTSKPQSIRPPLYNDTQDSPQPSTSPDANPRTKTGEQIHNQLKIKTHGNDTDSSRASTDSSSEGYFPQSPVLATPTTTPPQPGEIRTRLVHANGVWRVQTSRVPYWVFTKGCEHLIPNYT